jgi:lipocalin-like protein
VAKLSDRFVGTWRLVSFVGHGADGRETSTYGSKPHGFLIYDKGGRMSVQIARSDRRSFKSGDPFREATSANLSHIRNAEDLAYARALADHMHDLPHLIQSLEHAGLHDFYWRVEHGFTGPQPRTDGS